MDTQTVYLILDIIFTPLFDGATSKMLDVNNSKPVWVKTRLKFKDGKPVYPTFALSAVSPFVVSAEGVVLKCFYNPELEGVQVVGQELQIIDGIAINSDTNWKWKALISNRQALHKIRLVYKDLDTFRQCIQAYPRDNSLLQMIIKDAELEL